MPNKISKKIRRLILEEVLAQTDIKKLDEVLPVGAAALALAASPGGVAAIGTGLTVAGYNLFDQFFLLVLSLV